MQLWMGRLKSRYSSEVHHANNTNIRFFAVLQQCNFHHPVNELSNGVWQNATGKQLEKLSGIEYFFAKLNYQKNHVPIGLIEVAVGGTPIKS